jgi:hypothetical protein
MLQALQADVNAWPQRVKGSGVTNAGGAAYVPIARNLEILRTPDDPEATYAYMRKVWDSPDAGAGSTVWDRIISQVGPQGTWEWLMADPEKPYAPLFDDVRERVTAALESQESYTLWQERTQKAADAAAADTARIQRVMDEMRSGKRQRPIF